MAKHPSQTGMQAMAAPMPAIGGNGPAALPKRDAAANEALLEQAVIKLASLAASFDKFFEDAPSRAQLQEVYLEARSARRLLEQHIRNDVDERRAAAIRHDAVMSMMGDILARLPEDTNVRSRPTEPEIITDGEPEESSTEAAQG